jgi:hypothetical protein
MLHPADFVIFHTGFRTDSSLFRKIGVELHGEQEIPHSNPDKMETNIPGIYLAGTVAAGSQSVVVIKLIVQPDYFDRLSPVQSTRSELTERTVQIPPIRPVR